MRIDIYFELGQSAVTNKEVYIMSPEVFLIAAVIFFLFGFFSFYSLRWVLPEFKKEAEKR